MYGLEGKFAIVSGAATGIGRATAREREGNIPWGRVGLPEDIARVAVFLASDEAEYMTEQAINVTGGLWTQ